jgi:DNA adenine methylase
MKEKLKPLLKHPGGKSKEIKYFKEYYPKKIDKYIEPFAGGAAVYFDIDENIEQYIINDYDSYISEFYKIIQNQNNKKHDNFFKEYENIISIHSKINTIIEEIQIEIVHENNDQNSIDTILNKIKNHQIYNSMKNEEPNLSLFFEKYLTKNNLYLKKAYEKNENKLKFDLIIYYKKSFHEAIYYYYRDIYNKSLKIHNETYMNNDSSKHQLSLLDIFAWFYVKEFAFTGMVRYNNSGLFNVPYAGFSYMNKDISKKYNYFKSKEINNKFNKTIIENLDFAKLFQKYNYFTSNDFLFLDPPYDTKFSNYIANYDFDYEEQKRLKNEVSKLNCKWMMVIKKTDFIYDLYKEYNIIEFDKKYGINFKNRISKDTKEVIHLIIMNY